MPPVIGAGGCGIAHPVVLRGFVLAQGRTVALEPPALLRCDLAQVLADWVRDDLAPAGQSDGDMVALTDAAAYDCRGRNHLFGATLSQHATGNAIDILAFRFKAHDFAISKPDADPFWPKAKTSACARFATALGPGSDAYHRDNLHLDLQTRRNGLHICQWDTALPAGP